MRNLNLDLLRTFVAVAERSNFAGAAARVHRTQSAVTQQMQRLETQIGQPLFQKIGRSKKLTDEGQALLYYARRMLVLNDSALEALQTKQTSGTVRLGASHDVADTILPTLLSRFAKSYPQFQLTIDVGRSPFLMESLERGEVDLTISTRVDTHFPSVVLRTSPTIWLCAADFSWDRTRPVPLVLADEPSMFRSIALTYLDRAHIPWRENYIAPTLVGIKAAVRAGLGITARSIEMLTPELRALGEADGLPRLPDVTFWLYLRDRNVNEGARRFFELVKSETSPSIRGSDG